MIEILSPHVDDAVFSLGCYLLEQNEEKISIEITNCFNISNYLVNGKQSNSLEEIINIRKSEDTNVNLQFMPSIKFNYLNLKDAPLRGYQKCEFRGHLTQDDEHQLIKLRSYLKTKDSFFIVPLGLGNHIDHLLCQLSANAVRNRMLAFYEDLPYAGRMSELEILKHIKRVEKSSSLQLKPEIVGTNFIAQKEKLCRLYASQLKDWYLEKILSRMRQLQGERLWIAH